MIISKKEETKTAGVSRIEWIDTTKGIGILLVMINHISLYLNIGNNNPAINLFDNILGSIDMPLFFFISGYLYKKRNDVLDVIKNKIKRLLIPFLFFYIVFSVIIPVCFILFNCHCPLIINNGITIKMLIGDFIFNDCQIINGPLWFLLSLFEIQVLFTIVSKSLHKIALLGFSLFCGVIGLLLSFYSINLYLSIDNALTCFPFFIFGYYLRNCTKFLSDSNHYKRFYCILISAFACILTTSHVEFHRNIFFDYSYFTVYPCGIAGILLVIYIAKSIKNNSFLNYLGKYSIIVLCTHYMVLKLIVYILPINHTFLAFSITFIIVTISQFIIIPICRKYIPHLTSA